MAERGAVPEGIDAIYYARIAELAIDGPIPDRVLEIDRQEQDVRVFTDPAPGRGRT